MESSDAQPSAQIHNGSPICHNPEEINGTDSASALVPPYWSHRRYESYSSVKNSKPPPITLEDHTEDPSEQDGAVWASGVAIDDYVLVSGTVPSVGNFVVWNCKIETIDVSQPPSFSTHSIQFLANPFGMLTPSQGGSIVIRKRSVRIRLFDPFFLAESNRYSEFDDLRRKLLMTFPGCGGAMPLLPPKSLFCEIRPLSHIRSFD